ncbi:hypothetical protein RR46_08423 [Papilio xuthus]|uniref:Uncharacterized protein n=1 Tax=Papilio xuthus TaxID=66420 RepID=A0A194PFD7_PAPXU|nr:hypothetical protein RR46_08423 [Papilio xuthus]
MFKCDSVAPGSELKRRYITNEHSEQQKATHKVVCGSAPHPPDTAPPRDPRDDVHKTLLIERNKDISKTIIVACTSWRRAVGEALARRRLGRVDGEAGWCRVVQESINTL